VVDTLYGPREPGQGGCENREEVVWTRAEFTVRNADHGHAVALAVATTQAESSGA
jgi:hypothetical protein